MNQWLDRWFPQHPVHGEDEEHERVGQHLRVMVGNIGKGRREGRDLWLCKGGVVMWAWVRMLLLL
jgi:hypothetical protein